MMKDTRQLISETLSQFSYAPSSARQTVSIAVTYGAAIPLRGWSAIQALLIRRIDFGLGAGAVFPPHLGTQQIVLKPEEPASASAALVVEVSHVAPEFWISVAHSLSIGFFTAPGEYVPSTSVTIVGDAAAGRETFDRDWLLKACNPTRARHYEPVPFSWNHEPFDGVDAVVRVELGSNANEDLVATFEDYLNAALDYLSPFTEPVHDEDPAGNVGETVEIARSERELTAWINETTVRTEPLRAALLNALHCFHEKVAPLSNVYLRC